MWLALDLNRVRLRALFSFGGIMLNKIKEMHRYFKIDSENVPHRLPRSEKAFRYRAMNEEIYEYAEAETLEDELDALVDVVVFALGTAERQGMIHIFEEAFNRVIEANMMKTVGPNKNKDRGEFHIDLQKPIDWKAPNFDDLLKGDECE